MKWALRLLSGDVITKQDGTLPSEPFKKSALTALLIPERRDPCNYVVSVDRPPDAELIVETRREMTVGNHDPVQVSIPVIGVRYKGIEFRIAVDPRGRIEGTINDGNGH